MLIFIWAGVFVNQHQNLLVWVGQGDNLRLISMAQGQDLKYILLRWAVGRRL